MKRKQVLFLKTTIFKKCLTVIFASENSVQRHANNNTVEHKSLVIVMAMRDGSQVMLIKELGGV